MKYPYIIYQVVALQECYNETHICYCVSYNEAGRIVQLQKAEDEASVEVYETEEATIFCLPEIEYEIRILYGYFEDGGIEFESSVFGSWGLWFPVEPQDQIRVAADLKHLYKVLEAYEKAIGFIPAEVTFGPQE